MKTIPKTHIKAMVAVACTGVLTLAMAQSSSAQNLLTDPGFEQQISAPNPNPNGVPGWANFGGATFLSTPLAHSGSYVLDTPDNGGGYNVPGSYEVLAASPGETFTYSGWVYTPNALVSGDNDFAILQLTFYTGAPPNNYGGGTGTTYGVNVGDPAGGGGIALPQGVWTQASITETAPAGTGSIALYLLDINADANADFYFDDMSLTAAPEPSTIALAGVGLLGLLGSRLRRRI
jgi:PEP-CTERM motif